jgi:uncharacterized protein (TIGR03435 family)
MEKQRVYDGFTMRIGLALSAIVTGVVAQQPPPRSGPRPSVEVASERFDVASIKLHVSGSGYEPQSCSNGRFVSIGLSLIPIIAWAYDLNQGQMIEMRQRLPKEGGKTTLAYDIQAKSERALTKSQCKGALQALLADRFRLAFHWEFREGQVSDLVIARGGPKMPKWADTDTESGFNLTLNGTPAGAAPGAARPTGMTMQEFALSLTNLAAISSGGGDRQKPVIDKTGLDGKYKIDLKFSNRPPGGDQVFEDPDLETALQQQLGLKLETHKGILKTFLVDHIEPPSAN